MVNELSSPGVFLGFSNKMPEDIGVNAMLSMVTLFTDGKKTDNPLETGRRLFSDNFARFMGTELTFGLLAPAIGPEIDECRTDPSQVTFATDIGTKYPVKPTTPEEYMSRVRELLPDPDSNGDIHRSTLFSHLLTGNAFKPDRTKCPGIDATEATLNQVGRHLATPVYFERFKRRVTKKTYRQS